jgi:hypothetical protein
VRESGPGQEELEMPSIASTILKIEHLAESSRTLGEEFFQKNEENFSSDTSITLRTVAT